MSDTRGIFSLKEIFEDIIEGDGVDINTVFISDPVIPSSTNTGYLAGGNPQQSEGDKVNFDDDTRSAAPGIADLPNANYAAGFSSGANGYITGGQPFPGYTDIRKVNYSTETLTTIPAQLVSARYGLAASNTATNGYVSGGFLGYFSTFERFNFASETNAIIPGVELTPGRAFITAAGNQNFGYYMGGTSPTGGRSKIDKITYATDTCSNAGTDLINERHAGTAFANSSTAYVSGGVPGPQSYTDKVVIATDTCSNVTTGNLNQESSSQASLSNQSFGYACNGNTPGSPASSNIQKFTISGETYELLSAQTAYPYSGRAGVSARMNVNPTRVTFPLHKFNTTVNSTSGYNIGGRVGTLPPPFTPYASTSDVDKLDYSTDTSSTSFPFTFLGGSGGSLTNLGTAGYTFSGYDDIPNPYITHIGKIVYANDLTSLIPAQSKERRYAFGLSSPLAGYQLAGSGSSYNQSATDKLTFSTEVNAAAPSVDIHPVLAGSAWGYGKNDVGYVMGGNTTNSTGYKITYSADLLTTIPALVDTLPGSHGNAASFQSPSHGYAFGGRVPYVSSVAKFSFATDTREATNPLSSVRGYTTASGTPFNAYIVAGTGDNPSTSPGFILSSITRYNMTTDTEFQTSAVLSGAKYQSAAVGAGLGNNFIATSPLQTTTDQAVNEGPNAGYFVGGPGVAQMDKTDFITETSSPTPGANLTAARFGFGATGNSTHGYYGGGSSPITALMDKCEYATDTTSDAPGANLSVARYQLTATGNQTHGYFAAGRNPSLPTASPSGMTTVDKCTFATDSTSPIPSSDLSIAGYRRAAVGNANAGYFAGGWQPGFSDGTVMEKINYADDARSTLPANARLYNGGPGIGAVGNANAGYWTGGNEGPIGSLVEKTTYAFETTALTPGALLPNVVSAHGAAGNKMNAYLGGGSPGPGQTMQKITYSNDTSSLVPSADFSTTHINFSASSPRSNGGNPIPVVC